MTTVAFGADHAGYELKQHLIARLSAVGFDIIDHGTHSTESVDYPAFCAAAARSVRDGEAEFGIVIGGSGQGEQLAANKVGHKGGACNASTRPHGT
jgi:ribose 5-phosphate isomerase B